MALLPWERWPARATLAITPLAFAVIGVANQRGGVSTYSYAPFFILVFMWVGLHHPPRTSFLLAPLAAIAYMVPGLVSANAPDGALSSVTVAVPVCVLVAETIARTVGRMRRAERDIQRSYQLSYCASSPELQRFVLSGGTCVGSGSEPAVPGPDPAAPRTGESRV